MKQFITIFFTGLQLLADTLGISIEPPPPVKNDNTGFFGKFEKESYKDLNKRYRECMDRYKDSGKCGGDKTEPSDKYIFEYKK